MWNDDELDYETYGKTPELKWIWYAWLVLEIVLTYLSGAM